MTGFARRRCELEEVAVGPDPGDDAVDVAVEHSSHIGHPLALPQPDLLVAQGHGTAPRREMPTWNETRVRIDGF